MTVTDLQQAYLLGRENFDEIRVAAGDEASAEFGGWNSSYTGQPLTAEQMEEWAANTVERIAALGAKEILEIGCGSGILLRRLLPRCDRYIGTDLSSRTLSDLAGMLDPDLAGKVELHHVDAGTVASVVRTSVDAVVINSVAQYLPDVGNLLLVIDSVIPLVRPGGAIFLGDLRNLRLHNTFACSVELHRADPELSDVELAQRVGARLAAERELLVDPELFLSLAYEDGRISWADIVPRRDRHDTEMARYRYDAVLHVGPGTRPLPVGTWIDGRERDLNRESLTAMLRGISGPSLGLRGVPNAWIAGDAEARRLIDSGAGRTVAELRRVAAERAARGLTPAEVRALGAELGWAAFVSWAWPYDDGAFDVVFRRDGRTGRHDFGTLTHPLEFARYTNDPRAARAGLERAEVLT